MGSLRIFPLLLVSSFLLLFFSHGFGVEVMGIGEHLDSMTPVKESIGKLRKMIEVADYHDPRPNRPTMFSLTKISNVSPPSLRKMIEVNEDYHDPRPNRPTMFRATNVSPPSPKKIIKVADYRNPGPNRPTIFCHENFLNIASPPNSERKMIKAENYHDPGPRMFRPTKIILCGSPPPKV